MAENKMVSNGSYSPPMIRQEDKVTSIPSNHWRKCLCHSFIPFLIII